MAESRLVQEIAKVFGSIVIGFGISYFSFSAISSVRNFFQEKNISYLEKKLSFSEAIGSIGIGLAAAGFSYYSIRNKKRLS